MSTATPSQARARGALWNLAVEGVVPVVAGCAGALAAGPAGGMAGVMIGAAVEKAIQFFGRQIVDRWVAWFRGQPPAAQLADLNELADMPAHEARRAAAEAVERLVPHASPEDKRVAVDYLGALPLSVHRSLVQDKPGGPRTLPATVSTADARSLLQLLPTDVPPYAAPAPLPDSPYHLEELVGAGGFGAVYRARAAKLQHLPLAVKFCLDPNLLPSLRQERSNLERLMKSGGSTWSPRVVRLYGYDLEHPTPYLVYEFVAGGDLARWLAARAARSGKGPSPAEVRAVINQVVEGLAYAHARGLVHRDLKPANVLLDAGGLKLADFGIGGAVSRRAAQASRIGTVASDALSLAEQVSLYRGAGTPLYMSPEQRRGDAPDPRHDLYSLGVMWYQLLVGDVTRELHPGWDRELEKKYSVPREQIELIRSCVGLIEERPADAIALQKLLRAPTVIPAEPAPAPRPAPPPPPAPLEVLPVAEPLRVPEPVVLPVAEPTRRGQPAARTQPGRDAETERHRRIGLLTQVRRLLDGYYDAGRVGGLFGAAVGGFFLGLFLGFVAGMAAGITVLNTLSPPGGPPPPPYWSSSNPGSPEYRRQQQDYDDYMAKRGSAKDTSLAVGVSTGVGVFLLILFLKVLLRWRKRHNVLAELESRIDQLLADYPEECKAWGGRAALCDWRVVRDLEYELAPRRR
jgi:serine/threonine protein kinase